MERVAPNPEADDVALLERLKLYSDSVPESLGACILHVTGQSGRQWAMEDFELKRASGRKSLRSGTSKSKDTWESDLYYLTLEFLGYLRRVENVPIAKAEIGRRQLHRFILERRRGGLAHSQSMLDAATEQNDGRLGRPPGKRQFRPEHELVPDRKRFDLFLARSFDLLSPVPYEAMAAFEILPAWLRFLESKGLIDAKLRVHSLVDLEGLRMICAAHSSNPTTILRWSKHASAGARRPGNPYPGWKVQRRDLSFLARWRKPLEALKKGSSS